jgi:hypothetical protein
MNRWMDGWMDTSVVSGRVAGLGGCENQLTAFHLSVFHLSTPALQLLFVRDALERCGAHNHPSSVCIRTQYSWSYHHTVPQEQMSLRDQSCYTLILQPSASDPSVVELVEINGIKREPRYARVKERRDDASEVYSAVIYGKYAALASPDIPQTT